MSYAENEHFTCPWSWCTCSHVGCVAGWLERTADDGTEHVDACPTCRPEVAKHLARKDKSLQALRRELPGLPRPSRRRPMGGAA